MSNSSSSSSELLLEQAKLAAGCSNRRPKDSAGCQRPPDDDDKVATIGTTSDTFSMIDTTTIGQPRPHRNHHRNVQKLLTQTDPRGERGLPEVGRSCRLILRSNTSMELKLSRCNRYCYLLSFLLFMFMFIIVETSNGVVVPLNASHFEVPSSSTLAAIARKLRILNNQHAPPLLRKITGSSSNSYSDGRRRTLQSSSRNKQTDEILLPSPSQIIIPYSARNTGNQSASSGHELREVMSYDNKEFRNSLVRLPQAAPEVDIQAARSKSQRENDRRLQGNKLITSESNSIPWSLTATTQFDDDEDDLYVTSARVTPIPATIVNLTSRTPPGGGGSSGQLMDDTPYVATPTGPHRSQSSDAAKGFEFKLGHKVAASPMGNPSRRESPAFVGPIKSGNSNNNGEFNPTNLESKSQETLGLKATTNRRSVGNQPLADGGKSIMVVDGIQPNSSLKHLTLASEHSLLPLQDPAEVVNSPQPEVMLVSYDDQVAADNNNDLSQPEDRNASSSSTMKTTITRLHNNNSSIKNAGELPTSANDFIKLSGLEQQPTTISSYISENKLNNKKHTVTLNGTQTIVSPQQSKTNQNQDQNGDQSLSSLLLNSDVRVTSELLVLNRSSPIEGLVAKNLTGRAELRHPHSFFEKAQAAPNVDDDNNHEKSMVWPAAGGLFYEKLMGQNSLSSERRFAPTNHHLNTIEENSPAALKAQSAAAGDDEDNYNADGSSLKLNWRGPTDTQDNGDDVDDGSLLPTNVVSSGPKLEERTFYGPFSSGTHHRLSLGGSGLQDPSSSSSLGMNVRRQGSSPSAPAQGQTNSLSRQTNKASNKTSPAHPEIAIVTNGNGSIANISSSGGSIRLKAAASMTGIRVIADPKLASKLVINSRGLITAPKKRTGSSASNHSTLAVTTSGGQKTKSGGGGGGGGGKGKFGGGDRRKNPSRITNSNSTKKTHLGPPTTNSIKVNSSTASATAKDNQIPLDLVSGIDRPEWFIKPPSSNPPIAIKQVPTIMDRTQTDKLWRKNSSSSNNRFTINHVHQPTYDLMFEDGYSPGGGGGYFESGNLDSGGSLFSFEKGQKMNLSISNAHRHASSSSPLLPNRIIFHDISVMDEDDNQPNFIELPNHHTHDYHNPPDAPIRSMTSGLGDLNWLNGDNSTISASNILNDTKTMSNYFTHNPPYKHPLSPLASQMAAASQQENRTQLSSSYFRPDDGGDDDHYPLPLNSTTKYQIIPHQRHHQHTPQAFPTAGISQDRKSSQFNSSSEMNYLHSSSPTPTMNATTTPPYESSAAMISMNSSTISPQLNALDTNHPPLSPSQQQQATSQTTSSTTSSAPSNHHGSGSGGGNSKPANKFKNKLQHIIIGKILKNTQSLGNFTGATSPQPQWSTFPVSSSSSPSQPQATTTSMITPPPLLSTTVANNVASLLAQKLNFLVKPSFVSPFSSNAPQASQVSHGSGSGLNLGSLFGIRVGSGGAASQQAPSAMQPGGSNLVANKFKQRINPFIVPAHGSVNRRTAGMGSLLISGFIYGLSVLPALMALTGINPLNPSGDDQTASSSSSSSSTTRNSSPNRNGQHAHHKRSRANYHPGRRLPPLPPAGAASPVATSYAAGPYAYLVPMISTVAADVGPSPPMDGGAGPASQQSASSAPLAGGQHHDVGGQAQQTAIKSLYAPPPTIIEPPHVIAAAAADTPTHQSIMDEFGSYDVNSLRNHQQFKQNLPYHHRIYTHSSHHQMQPPSSLQLASSMRLINEQLDPFPVARYKGALVVGGNGGSHLLRYSQPMAAGSSASATNEWPPPSSSNTAFDQRADEFGDDEIISGDDENTNYAHLWHGNRNQPVEDGNKNHRHYQRYRGNRGFAELVDPIAAGDSQHHPTIDRASKRMSSGSSMMPAKNRQNYQHRQVVQKLNYKPVKVQNAYGKQNYLSSNHQHNTINKINSNRAKGFPNQGSLANQTDLWRAIPAPTIKGTVRQDSLNPRGGRNKHNPQRADG